MKSGDRRCLRTSLLTGLRWIPAAGAGVLAGVAATDVQLMLWWASGQDPVALLLRDARLAAAVVLGAGVLPPPSDFDWRVMIVAGALHLLLSAGYGLLLAAATRHLLLRAGAAAGMLCGLLLFVVNMYGFTLLFPWFAASRDWITAAAHAAFGIAAVVAYQLWPAENRLGRRIDQL